MSRPTWDEYWMMEAYLAAQMCTCARGRKQGSVFVRENRLLVKGFNGVPSGSPHPTVCKRNELNIGTDTNMGICGCKHSEVNGIANAAREGTRLKGSTLYCTSHPCNECMGTLVNVGISGVIYHNDYPSEQSAVTANLGIIVVKKLKGSEQIDRLIAAFPPARYGPSSEKLALRGQQSIVVGAPT